MGRAESGLAIKTSGFPAQHDHVSLREPAVGPDRLSLRDPKPGGRLCDGRRPAVLDEAPVQEKPDLVLEARRVAHLPRVTGGRLTGSGTTLGWARRFRGAMSVR